jgi:hypothetical protein
VRLVQIPSNHLDLGVTETVAKFLERARERDVVGVELGSEEGLADVLTAGGRQSHPSKDVSCQKHEAVSTVRTKRTWRSGNRGGRIGPGTQPSLGPRT